MPAPKGHPNYNTEGHGRPPKYSKEDIERYAEKFKAWLIDPSHVWFKDFALDHDFDPDYLSEWADENENFRGVYRQAKHRQISRLVNGGLLSAYNSAIVKLVLGNAHGWSERTETKLSGDAVNPLAFVLKEIDGTTKELVNDEDG